MKKKPGRLTDRERVGAWEKRVLRGNKVHEDWAREFDCDILEGMYYGHQWDNADTEEWDKRKYVINLFFPAVNISKPSLLFSVPKYEVTPRPTRNDDQMSDVETRAKLQETTLNSYVQDPKLGFELETSLAILDAQFRFGVMYVGYTADFIDNPNAGRPVLNDKQETVMDGDNQPVIQADVLPGDEQLFLEWIPGTDFRVADNAPNRLQNADWCGFSKWQRIEDLKNNKRYRHTANLKATGKLRDKSEGSASVSDEERQQSDMVKVWFIWDNRAKKRLVFAQGGEAFLLEEDFKFLPFAVLKLNERLGKFYPLPESYNWVHPQRELNDTREMQRIHRKRAVRRYGRRPTVPQEEFDKLVDGEDMVCIEMQNPETDIAPIKDAPLDAAVARNIPQSQDDFIRVSGVSGEAQQVAESETATQANLIALSGRVREASRRNVAAKWLSEIGRLMLLTLVDKMALPFWIKRNVDQSSPLAIQEAMEIASVWQSIEAEQLGGIDNDISVELTSLSPMAQAQEREEWLAFLGIVTNPVIGAVLANSPKLLRKTAGLFNVHNERDLAEIAKAMQLAALLAAGAGSAPGTAGAPKPGPTPTNGGIMGQLQQQLPVEIAQGTQ